MSKMSSFTDSFDPLEFDENTHTIPKYNAASSSKDLSEKDLKMQLAKKAENCNSLFSSQLII